MAERPLYTLYNSLKAQNFDVPSDYDTFEKTLTKDGKAGADNRHKIYNSLKAQNYDVPDSYEKFYTALFEPRSKDSSRAKGGDVPMTAADRARYTQSAMDIMMGTGRLAYGDALRYNKTKQRQQKHKADFGRVGIGEDNILYNNNVVKDEALGTYVTSDNQETNDAYAASRHQDVLDVSNQLYMDAINKGEIPMASETIDKNGLYDLQENIGRDGTTATQEGLQQQWEAKLNYAYQRRDELEKELEEARKKEGNALLSYNTTIGGSSYVSDEHRTLDAARRKVDEEIRNLEALNGKDSSTFLKVLGAVAKTVPALNRIKQGIDWLFGSGTAHDMGKAVENSVGAAETWDFGLSSFDTYARLERIRNKIQKNEQLTHAEQLFAQNVIASDKSAQLVDDNMGRAYRWTSVAGVSMPYMLDFLITGGFSGLTRAAGKFALKQATKYGMGTLGKTVTKYVGIGLGDIAGSYAMAVTEQGFKTGADVMHRHAGTLYQDEDGNYAFGTFDSDGNLVHKGGEAIGKALYKGVTAAMLENYTEKMFAHWHLKRGALKMMDKSPILKKYTDFFKNVGKSGWYGSAMGTMKKFGIGGYGEEVAEEIVNIPLNAALVGDNKLSELKDWKTWEDILGSMAISVGSTFAMTSAPHLIAGASIRAYDNANFYIFKNRLNLADQRATEVLGDDWAGIKERIDTAQSENLGNISADLHKQVADGKYSEQQMDAAWAYIQNLRMMRGYNLAKTMEMQAKAMTGENNMPADIRQQQLSAAYAAGYASEGEAKHEAQIEYEKQRFNLAYALGVSVDQLDKMTDEQISMSLGMDDYLDNVIFNYQNAKALYDGVMDNAQSQVDAAAKIAAQRIDDITDNESGTVRMALIKGTQGAEDYPVYIINGNVETHDDGVINYHDSDKMVIVYNERTGRRETIPVSMLSAINTEVINAEDAKAEAVRQAKEKAVTELSNDIDGKVEVGSQFTISDADGTEHTYEILADNGDGTAMITIDGYSEQNAYALNDLQALKDAEEQKALEAARAEREQYAQQQTQQNEIDEETLNNVMPYIVDDKGEVVIADVQGMEDQNTFVTGEYRNPNSGKHMYQIVTLREDGTTSSRLVNADNVNIIETLSAEEFEPTLQGMMNNTQSNNISEDSAAEESDLTNDGSVVSDEPAEVDDAVPTEEVESAPAITLEDGTIVPMLEDGNPDFSQLTASQTAELYDTQFGEDADVVINGWVSEAQKALDKAKNMSVMGKTFVEQKASKDAKERAIAEAQAAYDSAKAISDAYNERMLAKEAANPENATEEKPLGEQKGENSPTFSAKNKVASPEERSDMIEKNMVRDESVLDHSISKKMRKALNGIAKMMGAKIVYLHSADQNGWYDDKTNTIYLALDSADVLGVQFIFGHEMTHEIKSKNPAAYEELKRVIVDYYGDEAYQKAIDETEQKYSEAGFSGRDREYYAEEVVADAIGEMIRDLNLAHSLALKMSHPLLARIHDILQRIRMALTGTEYRPGVENIIRTIEQAYVDTAKGEVTNSETGEDVSFSLRQKPEPKKKGIGYKVFVLKDGKLYPPMVANPDGAATPVGVWLDADAAPIAGESKTGRPQVKQGGKGTQGGSGKLAYRPGWHLGVIPYALQFNRKDAEGNKTLFPNNFVFAEVEYAADNDYQEEARQEGINANGKYQHSLAGLKHLPTDGYYMYRTNPNPETDPWVITGAMKVNRILTRAEQAELVKNAGREPQQIQEGDIVTDEVVNQINQEISDMPKFSIKTWHGSQADFDKFDHSFMGAGEGAQAYGWGTYVSEVEGIAKSYANKNAMNHRKRDSELISRHKKESTRLDLLKKDRDVIQVRIDGKKSNLARSKKMLDEEKKEMEQSIKLWGEDSVIVKDLAEYIAKWEGRYLRDRENIKEYEEQKAESEKKIAEQEELLANLETQMKAEGVYPERNLYTVEIPDDTGDNYLEWDGNLTDKQSENIYRALYALPKEELDAIAKRDKLFRDTLYDIISNVDEERAIPVLVKDGVLTRKTTYDNNVPDTGGTVYTRLKDWLGGQKNASLFLKDAGFDGVKVIAQRNTGGNKEGKMNYVIFDENDAQIVEHTKFSLKTKPVRFEAGKKLSDEEKKEVLSTLKDAYKVKGVPYHIEETAAGKEKRVYEPTADSYVVSDITNRPLRYYITLPDGRVAHPTEVYPNISDNEVKSSATKQGLLDDEVDQIVRTAIGNMMDIADNAKAVEVLTELQNLPHETHDVGYGLNNAQSYNYKTGIFTSDAAQAIDYVVRRMRRKEDVPVEIPAALKKAVADSYGMVDNIIEGMSTTKFSLKKDGSTPEIANTPVNIVDADEEHGFKNYAEAREIELLDGKNEGVTMTQSLNSNNSITVVPESYDVNEVDNSKAAIMELEKKKAELEAQIADLSEHEKENDKKADSEFGRQIRQYMKEHPESDGVPPAVYKKNLEMAKKKYEDEKITDKLESLRAQLSKVDTEIDSIKKVADGIRFSLAGQRGVSMADRAEERGVRLDNLATAKNMEGEGKPADVIKSATGWERGADNKWRYEMPDVTLKNPEEWIGKKTLTLADIVGEETELFSAYPDLKNIKIKKGRAKSGGSYNGEEITLNLGDLREAIKYDLDIHKKLAIQSLQRTLVHEVQHYIQEQEGFERGGNEHMVIDKKAKAEIARLEAEKDAIREEFKDMSDAEKNAKKYEISKKLNAIYTRLNDIEKRNEIGYDGYERLSGEVEARNVANRQGMTPEEKRNSLAADTEDVAREDQLFINAEENDTEQNLAEHRLTKQGDVVMSDYVAEMKKDEGYETPYEKGEFGDDAERFSLRTLPHTIEYYKTQGAAKKSAIKALENWMVRTSLDDNVSNAIVSLTDGMEGGGKTSLGNSPIRKQGDIYGYTIDFDTSCERTFVNLTCVREAERRLGRPLTLKESIQLNEHLRAFGLQIPCVYCYVENKRQATKDAMFTFLSAYQGVMNADTEEKAREKMYGHNPTASNPTRLTDSAEKAFKVWNQRRQRYQQTGNQRYTPNMYTLYNQYMQARSMAMAVLDNMLAEGEIAINKKTSSLADTLANKFLVHENLYTDMEASDVAAAKSELESIVEEWKYDMIHKTQHMNMVDVSLDEIDEVSPNALSLWHIMSNYAKSSSGAKTVSRYMPYTDELKYLKPEEIERLNSVGGIRMHSNNDFRIDYVTDYFQLLPHLEKLKLMVQAYTKSPDFVRIFGKTGIRINMSCAAYGGENGHKVMENQDEGFSWETAKELRSMYPNAGVMMMVTNDEQLSEALNQDWIDMIIPFHASGLPKAVWFDMRKWKDYTRVQEEVMTNQTSMRANLSEKGIDWKSETSKMNDAERAKWVEDRYYKENGLKEYWEYNPKKKEYVRANPHFEPNDKKVVNDKGTFIIKGHHNDRETYLNLCKQYDVKPRFAGIKVKDADGNEIDITEHPNYMNLIKETARTDSKQKAVQFNVDKVDDNLPLVSEENAPIIFGDKYKDGAIGKHMTPMQYAMTQLYDFASKGGYGNVTDYKELTTSTGYGDIVGDYIDNVVRKNRPIDYLSDNASMMAEFTRPSLVNEYGGRMPYQNSIEDDGTKFSISDKSEGWKQANKKAINIAEAIERDPKFSLKNLDGTLIKAGTYFSGGGLVEEGLKGIIDPVVAVEYDEKISGVYRNNFGQHLVTADVRDVDPRELVKSINGEVEYFHASPVCKNYSQAKANREEVELDKETAQSTADFINQVKPKVVTIENVKGYRDSEAMNVITNALDENGYKWDADIYNAADYGGYTNRERLIVRAVRDGELPEKPKKTERKKGWFEAVEDIIPTLTEKKSGVAPWMDVRLLADGIDWRDIDKPLYVMGSAYADGKIPHAFGDELLPTLRTKSGDVIVMPDGKVYRATGRVLARVSGVSDDYKMPYSEALSHTIIGNGIPTQLTENVIAPLVQGALRPTSPEGDGTRFSLRYNQYERDLAKWKRDNGLDKDAQRPIIPTRNPGESAVDFMDRVNEYRRQMALWKTAPQYEGHLLSDSTAQGMFNQELQRSSVIARIALQDSMLAIRKAQEAIMKEVGIDNLNIAEDAYTAENRSHGKGKNEFEEYNDEFLQPLREAYSTMMKILGKSYDNVKVYMIAKHGLERNAHIAFKKALEADFDNQADRIDAYNKYMADNDRMLNDADFSLGSIDFSTWRQRDNAVRRKYAPSFMDYRYDENGIVYDYSGLSSLFDGTDFEEAAAQLVKDIEDKNPFDTNRLWDATNAATKKILRDSYKAGMMSEDVYNLVRGMYKYYIPLRGWSDTNADQVWNYVGGGKGVFNQTLKEAHGRETLADDPIAYIENMAESGILLNNKNWVKQHLLLLAENHPTSLLNVSKAWYVKTTDANGNEEWIPASPQITPNMTSQQVEAALDAFEKKMEQMQQNGDATQKREHLEISYPQTNGEEREHEVRVMRDGVEYVIYVNGDPQLAQAMNNSRAHRVREGLENSLSHKILSRIGRSMAALYTSLSPIFIPSNFARDTTMTLASTAIREDARYNYLLRKNMLTHWNTFPMVLSYQNGTLREKVRGGSASKTEQMFYDFMMNGGETGFVTSMDVEDLKKKFKNDLKDLNRMAANPKKVGHMIMNSIETLNRAIEDSNRFMVYMTSIQYGRSIEEAVNDAKNVTLNFNRKGTGEHGWQNIRNLYLFINPAVQSLQNIGALAKNHPFKFTAVTTAWIASGVITPAVNIMMMSMFGGDDDKDKYWSFSKWDRRNNFIMWIPFTHNFVKIPLAQEFRGFYAVGDMIASKLWGGEKAEESWEQYGVDLMGQVVDMLPLDPTGYDGNIAVSLMPNPIRPVFELAFNVDFTGKPLFKDSEFNKYDPNFTKAYAGTPDWLVRVSRMVNSIGNDYPNVQQNAIDKLGSPRYNLNNPAVVDHVLSSYLGGAYTMGSQVLGVATKLLNGDEIKMADVPLASKFIGNPDDRPASKKQGDEFWTTKERHDRAANTLSKLKKKAKVDGDYSTLEMFYNSDMYNQYKLDDAEVKKYEEDKKKEKAEESGEEYKARKTTSDDIYKAHTTPNDEFEDMKVGQIFTKVNEFNTYYNLKVETGNSQSKSYYEENKAAIDAAKEVSDMKSDISELKKGFLDDGEDSYNDEDMKKIRAIRKQMLAVLEKANKVVVEKQKAKAQK